MSHPGVMRVFACLLAALAVAGCDRERAGTTTDAGADAAVTRSPAAPVKLEDVLEVTQDYVIGISYPQEPIRDPHLAAEMKRHAEAARTQFLQAVQSRNDGGEDRTLYDLSLSFTEVHDSPQLLAYAAEGSSFTGGAHGTPLLARFVWLPQENRRLASTDLVPGAAGWMAIAAYVREELHTALSQRVDADELAPAERAEVIKSAGRMIDEGTAPDPANFSQFEPVVDSRGKLTALRFVFAPYQVGPYSDGIQSVEVPAAVLLPHVAPEYRDLFARA